MRKLVMATAAAVTTFTAVAQTPLQCVNPDILNGVLFSGRSQLKMEVTRGLPEFLGNFRAPPGLSLIGTGVRGGGTSISVAYRSTLSTDTTYAAITAALGTEGWAVESTEDSGSTFSVAGGNRSGTLCRDDVRRTVMVWDAAGVSYANILVSPQADLRQCNAPVQVRAIVGARGELPRFRFPAGTSLARGAGAGMGSNTNFTSTSRITSPESAAQLVQQLASQMREQGWSPDADWSGAGSAGSTWRKTIDGQPTWGTLEITGVGKDTYDVEFTSAQP